MYAELRDSYTMKSVNDLLQQLVHDGLDTVLRRLVRRKDLVCNEIRGNLAHVRLRGKGLILDLLGLETTGSELVDATARDNGC